MNRLILAVALAAGGSLASAIPVDAATRNYDCSKAGNANKAQCKGSTAKAGLAVNPAKVAAAQAKANARAEKAQAKANATAAKAAGVKPAPKAAAAAPAKPGLLARMSSMFSRSSASAPSTKPTPRRVAAAAPASVEDRNPAGAIAACKDGTYSHAKARTGACSRHGGVSRWS